MPLLNAYSLDNYLLGGSNNGNRQGVSPMPIFSGLPGYSVRSNLYWDDKELLTVFGSNAEIFKPRLIRYNENGSIKSNISINVPGVGLSNLNYNYVTKKCVYIFETNALKIFIFDHNGNLLNEKSITTQLRGMAVNDDGNETIIFTISSSYLVTITKWDGTLLFSQQQANDVPTGNVSFISDSIIFLPLHYSASNVTGYIFTKLNGVWNRYYESSGSLPLARDLILAYARF